MAVVAPTLSPYHKGSTQLVQSQGRTSGYDAINFRLVGQIAKEFSEVLFGILYAMNRGGTLYLIDGGTR